MPRTKKAARKCYRASAAPSRRKSVKMPRSELDARERRIVSDAFSRRIVTAIYQKQMEMLCVHESAQLKLYDILGRWCNKRRRQMFFGHVGALITTQDVERLANRVGHKFWGTRRSRVINKLSTKPVLRWRQEKLGKRTEDKQLKWPEEKQKICAGLHALLVKMLAAPDTKPENEAKSMGSGVEGNHMQTDSEENADVALTTADELAEIQNGVEQLQLTQNASMVDADSFGAMRAGLAELSIGS